MFSYPAALGALSIVRSSEEVITSSLLSAGISKKQYQKVTSGMPWVGAERNDVRRTLDALIHCTIDCAGLPRIDVPAEFVAMVIAVFVHPVNLMTACVFLEGKHNWVEDIPTAEQDPIAALERVSASRLFSLVCEVLGDEDYSSVRTGVEKKMTRRVTDPVSEGTG